MGQGVGFFQVPRTPCLGTNLCREYSEDYSDTRSACTGQTLRASRCCSGCTHLHFQSCPKQRFRCTAGPRALALLPSAGSAGTALMCRKRLHCSRMPQALALPPKAASAGTALMCRKRLPRLRVPQALALPPSAASACTAPNCRVLLQHPHVPQALAPAFLSTLFTDHSYGLTFYYYSDPVCSRLAALH
jgi:hypothetical protein